MQRVTRSHPFGKATLCRITRPFKGNDWASSCYLQLPCHPPDGIEKLEK